MTCESRWSWFDESQRPVPGKGMCVEHGPTLKQQSVRCAGTEHEHVLDADEKRTGSHPGRPEAVRRR